MKFKTAKEALENQDIVILPAGKHTCSDGRVIEFSVNDLKEIIKNTDLSKASNVLHHPTKTTYSLADFSSLKIIKNNLVARLTNVKDSFANSVKSGLFPSRSVRITHDKQLEHLGWLPVGVSPAIEGMPSVEFEESKFYQFNHNNSDIKFIKKGSGMDEETKKLLIENAKLRNENEANKKLVTDFEANKTDLATVTKENTDLKAKVKTLEDEQEKVKSASFETVIDTKLKEVETDEKKKEVKVSLSEMSKNFTNVKDFQKALDFMKFDSKVTPETGETKTDFEKDDTKKLAADFEALLDDPKKIEELEKKDPKKFKAMENAFYS